MRDKDETTTQETPEAAKQPTKAKKVSKPEVDIDALIERVDNLEQCVVRLANVAGAKQFADKYKIIKREE